ncbi:choice-of-anchor J domain-containing protein [Virgibacillus necropolis]|uniref:Peptidase M6 n=1 Tax=Virgibacillus necropolis TaxID=163877 RepID=A0A221M8M0_9BACI|nr:choice-of-anchor J domain-containing protein [Virgibacillus necropolis]ASN04006.1 peptidase M6 [Virgibacillus necropolis]
MKKLVVLTSTLGLALSLVLPTASFAETGTGDTIENWDKERYGDIQDITSELNRLSKDVEFKKKAKEKIKEAAKALNGENLDGKASTAADTHFTFDGGTKQFLDRNLAFQSYTLRSVGENVEIWVADDLGFPEGDPRPDQVVTQEQVDKLAAEFDSNIYPTVTGFFGTPDSLTGSNALLEEIGAVPEGYYETGNDKVQMLVSNIPDDNYNDPTYPFFVAGFFWQTLEMYTDRNIISIDSNNWEERLEGTFYSTTIHEMQHLIHADNDGDETSWLNEGFSTFSEYLGGYGHDAGSINFLLDHPENSLTNWDEHVGAETGPETIADYGLVYLFTLYNYEQFGQDFILEVAKSPLNSIESYNQAYKDNGINETFQSVFEKFVTAVLIDDADNIKGKKGIYGFDLIDLRELPVGDGEVRGTTVNFEQAKLYEKDGVPAWGADYKVLDFDGKIDTITFDGIDFLPLQWETVADPFDESNQVFWGGTGAEADNNLIFKADLTGTDDATLTFDHFVDIEESWDYGVIQVSTDGKTWTSLANENTRSDVVEEGYPKIKENVPGFTGHSEVWTEESFDLSEYAGQEIYISFRYLTDWGYQDSGWFVDNIEVPEAGLSFDGTSTDSFMSKSELLEDYVNYSVTFVNEDRHGKYKVMHVDPFNVTDEDALQLRQLFKKGTNYMTTWYAAPSDQVDPVPFEYSIELKDNKGKHKGKKK